MTPNTKQIESSELQEAFQLAHNLETALSSVIRGRSDTIRLIVSALLADGHVLLEDYPGSGKTTLAKTLGRLISKTHDDSSPILPFRRVQFTPDMLPGDVLGVNIFEPKTGSFRFLHGPVFAHVVLADEINRTGPKVQAAFLECMAEKQVTIDNVTHPLDDLFFVLGTQNPLDIAGTYPLPQVQLDRFLLKVPMSYVGKADEMEILTDSDEIHSRSVSLAPVCNRDEVIRAREAVRSVHVSPSFREAVVDIAQATRNNPIVQFGASTRAALMLQSAARSWALLSGRDYVSEEDLVAIAPYVLLHRLRFHGGAGDARVALTEIMAPHIEAMVRRGR